MSLKTMFAATSVLASVAGVAGFIRWKKRESISDCCDKTVTGHSYESVIYCFGEPEGIHTQKVIVYPFFIFNIATVNFDRDEKVAGKYLYSSP